MSGFLVGLVVGAVGVLVLLVSAAWLSEAWDEVWQRRNFPPLDATPSPPRPKEADWCRVEK